MKAEDSSHFADVYLHSTMFLLIHAKAEHIYEYHSFTFHNVSINTAEAICSEVSG